MLDSQQETEHFGNNSPTSQKLANVMDGVHLQIHSLALQPLDTSCHWLNPPRLPWQQKHWRLRFRKDDVLVRCCRSTCPVKIRFASSTKKLSTFSRWKWEQPSSVKLCIHIILHSEAQISNCRNKKENILFLTSRSILWLRYGSEKWISTSWEISDSSCLAAKYCQNAKKQSDMMQDWHC